MSNITLKLITANINIAVNGNAGSISVLDANGNVTSAVPIINHRPYDQDRKALVRALYVQSFNSELVLDDADRELYRKLALKLASEVKDADNDFYVGEYCEVRENNNGIIGWVDVSRQGDKVVSIGVGMELGADSWTHHYDVSNGPVPFNAPLYTDSEFLSFMGKVTNYAIANQMF